MKDSIADLRGELRRLQSEAKAYALELKNANKEQAKVRQEIALAEKQEGRYDRDTKSLLRKKRPGSSRARYALFNQILRRYTKDPVFRDRLPDGRLSIKVGFDGQPPKKATPLLRRLADESRLYTTGDPWGTTTWKAVRFYFKGIPRRKK